VLLFNKFGRQLKPSYHSRHTHILHNRVPSILADLSTSSDTLAYGPCIPSSTYSDHLALHKQFVRQDKPSHLLRYTQLLPIRFSSSPGSGGPRLPTYRNPQPPRLPLPFTDIESDNTDHHTCATHHLHLSQHYVGLHPINSSSSSCRLCGPKKQSFRPRKLTTPS
jgi:hypothetical protein